MKNKTPAIPEVGTPLPFRWFEVHERVTAFEDREHELMRIHRRRYPKGDLEGQVKLDV